MSREDCFKIWGNLINLQYYVQYDLKVSVFTKCAFICSLIGFELTVQEVNRIWRGKIKKQHQNGKYIVSYLEELLV